MKPLVCLLIAAQLLRAQEPKWSASFVSTGDQVLRGALGRSPKGVAVYSGQVCSGDAAVTLDEGIVLSELHRRGVVIFAGKSLDAFLVRNNERSTAKILANWGEGISAGTAVVTASGVVQINPQKKDRYSFASVFAVLFFRWISTKVGQRSIDPEQLRSYMLPATIDLAANQRCWRGDVLGLFDPAKPSATFNIPTPVQ